MKRQADARWLSSGTRKIVRECRKLSGADVARQCSVVQMALINSIVSLQQRELLHTRDRTVDYFRAGKSSRSALE
jgi:hypothetical protein